MNRRSLSAALGLCVILILGSCDLFEALLGSPFTLSIGAEKEQAASDEPVEFFAVIEPEPTGDEGYTFQWFINDVAVMGIPEADARVWYKGLASQDRTVSIRLKATDSKGRSMEAQRYLDIFAGGSLRIYNTWAPTYGLQFYDASAANPGPQIMPSGQTIPTSKESIVYGVTPDVARHLAVSVYDPYEEDTPKTVSTWTVNFDQLSINTFYEPGVPKFILLGWSEAQRYNDIVRTGSDVSTDRMGTMPNKPLAFKYLY